MGTCSPQEDSPWEEGHLRPHRPGGPGWLRAGVLELTAHVHATTGHQGAEGPVSSSGQCITRQNQLKYESLVGAGSVD